MRTVDFWVIKRKGTDETIPPSKGYLGKGGTWVEPTDESTPRLFPSERAAKCFLTIWLRGKQSAYSYQDHTGEWDVGVDLDPVPHRQRSDMEILKVSVNI